MWRRPILCHVAQYYVTLPDRFAILTSVSIHRLRLFSSRVDRFLYHKVIDSARRKRLRSQHYSRTVSKTFKGQYPRNIIANKSTSIVLDEYILKTCLDIQNGSLGAENEHSENPGSVTEFANPIFSH